MNQVFLIQRPEIFLVKIALLMILIHTTENDTFKLGQESQN